MDHRVRAVIDIVERDLKHPADWSTLGDIVRLSPSGLRRLFTLSTGLSPSAYLTRLRFERARQLLSTPDTALLRVKEIMAEVGVNEPSHYAREFKKRYGVTPESFRRRSLDCARAGDSTN
jgi:AraC-like DNA-binding protein